jgi:hypothetical protein
MSHSPCCATHAALDSPTTASRHFLVPFNRLPPHHSAFPLDLVKTRGDVYCRCLISSLMVSRGTRNDTTFTAVALGAPILSPNLSQARPAAGGGGAEGPPEGCAPIFIRACGRHIKALRPDQTTCAAILSATLPPHSASGEGHEQLIASGALNNIDGKRGCCQGIYVGLGGIPAAVQSLAAAPLAGACPLAIVLQEGAAESLEALLARVTAATPSQPAPTSYLVILGDNEGLSSEQSAQLTAALEAARVPLAYASLGSSELLASQCMVIVHYLLDQALGASAVAKSSFVQECRYADKIYPCQACSPYHPDLLLSGAGRE